jgi:rare lipoprotein A
LPSNSNPNLQARNRLDIGLFSALSPRFCIALLSLLFLIAGCARKPARVAAPPAPVPGEYVEQGIASWYGVPFNGRRAANGEIYDMNKPTAAHRTLPFGSVVRVTNLDNGRQTEVRIIDRGPFVQGRIIDLSFAAARSVDMVGVGIAHVRLELMTPGRTPVDAGAFTVQVGAFTVRKNAENLREKLGSRYGPIFIQDYGYFYRVRVGRAPSVASAEQLASRLRSQQRLNTFVVRLDEAP